MQDASKMSPSHYISPPEFWFSPSLTPDTKTVTTYLKTCFHLLSDFTLEVSTRHAPRYKLHKGFSEANICNCYRASPGLSCHDCTTPATFRPTKFKFLYVAPNCAKISFIEMRTYFSSGLILRDIPNSMTPHTPSALFFLVALSWTEVPVKAGTCARDRRALQQLALKVHVKHSDLT